MSNNENKELSNVFHSESTIKEKKKISRSLQVSWYQEEPNHRSNRTRFVLVKLKEDFIMCKDNDEEEEIKDDVHLVYCLYTGVLTTYEEAINTSDSWEGTIQREINAVIKHETCDPVTLPKDMKPID